jgi:hypothetical protein
MLLRHQGKTEHGAVPCDLTTACCCGALAGWRWLTTVRDPGHILVRLQYTLVFDLLAVLSPAALAVGDGSTFSRNGGVV